MPFIVHCSYIFVDFRTHVLKSALLCERDRVSQNNSGLPKALALRLWAVGYTNNGSTKQGSGSGHGADGRPRGMILSPNRTTTLTPFRQRTHDPGPMTASIGAHFGGQGFLKGQGRAGPTPKPPGLSTSENPPAINQLRSLTSNGGRGPALPRRQSSFWLNLPLLNECPTVLW